MELFKHNNRQHEFIMNKNLIDQFSQTKVARGTQVEIVFTCL